MGVALLFTPVHRTETDSACTAEYDHVNDHRGTCSSTYVVAFAMTRVAGPCRYRDFRIHHGARQLRYNGVSLAMAIDSQRAHEAHAEE